MAGATFVAVCVLPASTPAHQSTLSLPPSSLTLAAPASDAVALDAGASSASELDWLKLSPLPGERAPLRAANSMVEHHAAMDVALFDDPVSATMVSYHSARLVP